jgi:hypothetical protein
MALLTGQAVGVRVLEAFGLPSKHCTELTISFKPDEIVVAKATYAADSGGLEEVIEILKTLKAGE